MTIGDSLGCFLKFLDDHNGALTAVATVVMAIFTGFLWYSTKKLWLAGERQAAHSKEEFEYTKKKLEESAEQAQKQTLLIGLQTDILEKQKEISRQQFLATHRSRLVLREAFVVTEPGEPIVVEYVLANIGGNQCKIVKSTMVVEFHTGGIPSFLPSGSEENDVGDVSLQPGEHYRGVHNSVETWPVAHQQRSDCYFCGEITYEDGAGISLHTGFFRCFDPAARRFVVLDAEKDLNYSD